MKMIYNYDANRTHSHNKGFALSLVLKGRFFGTQKWPINVKRIGGSTFIKLLNTKLLNKPNRPSKARGFAKKKYLKMKNTQRDFTPTPCILLFSSTVANSFHISS